MSAADSLVIGGELGRRRPRRPRSEHALIRGALAGSEADLEALFHRFWPRAYRAAFLVVHEHEQPHKHRQTASTPAVTVASAKPTALPAAPRPRVPVGRRRSTWR